MQNVKVFFATVLAAVGGFLSCIFGGWDDALITMLIFMAIDFLTGWIVAGVFHKSGKSETGALDSKASWRGLVKKGCLMLIVVVAIRLDMMAGDIIPQMADMSFFRTGSITAIVANELLSILENFGLMGIRYPAVLDRAIEVLNNRNKKNEETIGKEDDNVG